MACGKKVCDPVCASYKWTFVGIHFQRNLWKYSWFRGILSSEEKKSRHRRSLVRVLFEYYKSDRLFLCLDPGDFDLLQDFCSDIVLTRVLEIVCLMDDDYILGHAKRVNLISDTTSAGAISALLPSIRNELYHQSERITDAGFDNFFRITEEGNLKKDND